MTVGRGTLAAAAEGVGVGSGVRRLKQTEGKGKREN